MYPQKVLQGIPNLKRAVNFRIFNLLIMPNSNVQLVRHGLLRQPCVLASFF